MLQMHKLNYTGPLWCSFSWDVHKPRQASGSARCRAKTLVVVESPTKAQKISDYLGNGYMVTASLGHVRQLPSKPGVVDPDNSFKMNWQVSKKDVVQQIVDMAGQADKVLLASDPDREGEAIAWHVSQILQEKGRNLKGTPIHRISFSEITKGAVQQAVSSPRAIDTDLVRAYTARIATDYLLGYSLSPLLWRKLRGAKSAGRVQSVALRLVCDREAERDAHASITFYSITAFLDGQPQPGLVEASVSSQGVSKFEVDPSIGKGGLLSKLKASGTATVENVQYGTRTQKSPLPYTTARLQQDGARYLGFSVKQTMSTAQKLFERGLITYHRTDGVAIAEDRRNTIRDTISANFPGSLPEEARLYKSKVKNAQEAHDAITVIDPHTMPCSVKGSATERALHQLVWQSTVACQMTDAQYKTVRATLHAADCTLQVSASKVTSEGYLAVWSPQDARATLVRARKAEGLSEEQEEDPVDEDSSEDAIASSTATAALQTVPTQNLYGVLDGWTAGDLVDIKDVVSQEHHTEPPRRYSEASLVKQLEARGVGRPSTYGHIMEILIARQYVTKENRSLVPTSMGRVLTTFLKLFFSTWVDVQFTAGMETQLDQISAGEKDDQGFLKTFWSQLRQSLSVAEGVDGQQVFEDVATALEDTLFPEREDGLDRRACPKCKDGRLYLNGSPSGAFVACSNYRLKGDQKCKYIRNFAGEEQSNQEWEVGIHPEYNSMIYIKSGRYGRYATVNAAGKDINMSLPDDIDPEALTCEQALELLKGPKILGQHDETELDITLNKGRFGPYYAHGSLSISVGRLPEGEEPSLEHGLARLEKKAVKLGTTQAEAALAEPKRKRKTKAQSETGKAQGRKSSVKRKMKPGSTASPPGSTAGTQVHHLWISDWRKKTGGSLKDGRAAWKALGQEGKAAAKATYSAQLA